MAKKSARPVFLTEDEKLNILKEYEESGFKAKEICEKHKIGIRSLYNYKNQLWGIYQSTKSTVTRTEQIRSINNVKVDNSRRIALVERKAGDVIEKVLNLIEYKLDIEQLRLKGELQTAENPIPVNELTRFFQVAAPYFLQTLQPDESKGKTLMNTHKYITNILNQQVNIDGNKEN